jgi:hypothetical protein
MPIAEADTASRHGVRRIVAQAKHRVARIAHAAGAVEVEHRMPARAASFELHAKAFLLVELRNGAILRKIRIKRGIDTFVHGRSRRLIVGIDAAGKADHGSRREASLPQTTPTIGTRTARFDCPH